MALQNVWHHRKVADNSAKACWICYKPSTSVLITPDNKVRPPRSGCSLASKYCQDFFYTCIGHLSDRGFCQPDADEAAAAAAREKKEELDREIEKVKKEYEEKQKIKREKRKAKEKEKDKEDKEKASKNEEEEDKDEEKAKDDKVCHSLHLSSLLNFDSHCRSRSFLNRKTRPRSIWGPGSSLSTSKYPSSGRDRQRPATHVGVSKH